MSPLASLLAPGQTLRQLDDGLFSAFAEDDPRAATEYDSAAVGYDLLIGNPLYNRILWGVWPSTYAAFCDEALRSATDGPMLDAGCGTLVFTAEQYLRHADRPAVLVDNSLGMLRRARARLLRGTRAMPEHIALLQADLLGLPFAPGSFATSACWGVLHLFEEPEVVVRELARVTAENGEVHCTSLVADRPLGGRYLGMLSKRGIAAAPKTSSQLRAGLSEAGFDAACRVVGNVAGLSLQVAPNVEEAAR
jgi:ubiquinone/menaquinone biosynthesis C-methylase UbiE